MYLNFTSALFGGLSALIFPPLCLHCNGVIEEHERLLCSSCFSSLRLLDPAGRCPSCFALLDEERCRDCREVTHSWQLKAGCFEYTGAAKSLLLAFKYNDSPYLATSLASFMFLQYDRLQLPPPDIITYIPQSFLRKASRSYNQSKLLAESFAKIASKPVDCLLKKETFTLSQTLLDKEEREALSLESFSLIKGSIVQDKVILVIDDVSTTGATLEAASFALKNGSAKSIYVFSCFLTEGLDN